MLFYFTWEDLSLCRGTVGLVTASLRNLENIEGMEAPDHDLP